MTKKRNNLLIAFIILFLSVITNVKASDLEIPEISQIVDFNKKGNIKITLVEKTSETAISGAEISLFHIASVEDKDHNIGFIYTDELKECEVNLKNLEEENLTENISNCIKSNTSSLKKKTNEQGEVSYSNLTLGLYLVRQTNKVEGYSVIDEFLVMVPKVEDNKWTYSIKAEPKTDLYQTIDISVSKVWNKQNKNTKLPEKVTIELRKGTEIVDTIELSNKNNWTYTWEDIEKSDDYTVKEINVPKGYTASYKNNGYIFTITNTDELSQTGQIYFPIIFLAGAGVLLILLGILEFKKENNEE